MHTGTKVGNCPPPCMLLPLWCCTCEKKLKDFDILQTELDRSKVDVEQLLFSFFSRQGGQLVGKRLRSTADSEEDSQPPSPKHVHQEQYLPDKHIGGIPTNQASLAQLSQGPGPSIS